MSDSSVQKRKNLRKAIKEKGKIINNIIFLFDQFQSTEDEEKKKELRKELLLELEPAYNKFMEDKSKNEAIQTSLIRANIDLTTDNNDFMIKQIESVKTFFIFNEINDGNKLLTSIIKSLDNKTSKSVLDKIDEVIKLRNEKNISKASETS